jgi:hypothetical protein
LHSLCMGATAISSLVITTFLMLLFLIKAVFNLFCRLFF